MGWVCKVVCLADGRTTNLDGGYLTHYDPDGGGGVGAYDVTTDVSQALVFEDVLAFQRFYRQQSTAHPLRPDGKPNRPMTALTVELIRLPIEGVA